MRGLREEGDDGYARVPADDGDDDRGGDGGILHDLGDECGGAHDVEGRYAEETLGVEDAGLLEDFGDDGDRAAYRC